MEKKGNEREELLNSGIIPPKHPQPLENSDHPGGVLDRETDRIPVLQGRPGRSGPGRAVPVEREPGAGGTCPADPPFPRIDRRLPGIDVVDI